MGAYFRGIESYCNDVLEVLGNVESSTGKSDSKDRYNLHIK